VKAKGTRFERELLGMLWKAGFAAVRVPASGAMSYPSPDIVAGNGERYLAIEVKMRSSLPLYVPKEDIDRLEKFSRIFGAEAVLAVRISKVGWRFVFPELLKRTKNGYKVDEEVFYSGLEFDELTGRYRQCRVV